MLLYFQHGCKMFTTVTFCPPHLTDTTAYTHTFLPINHYHHKHHDHVLSRSIRRHEESFRPSGCRSRPLDRRGFVESGRICSLQGLRGRGLCGCRGHGGAQPDDRARRACDVCGGLPSHRAAGYCARAFFYREFVVPQCSEKNMLVFGRREVRRGISQKKLAWFSSWLQALCLMLYSGRRLPCVLICRRWV